MFPETDTTCFRDSKEEELSDWGNKNDLMQTAESEVDPERCKVISKRVKIWYKS